MALLAERRHSIALHHRVPGKLLDAPADLMLAYLRRRNQSAAGKSITSDRPQTGSSPKRGVENIVADQPVKGTGDDRAELGQLFF